MAKRRTFLDRLPLAPVFALMFGAAIAIVIALIPAWRFEQMVAATGLGSVLSVAAPPLGLKARLLAVTLGFALVAILVWLAVTAVQRLIEGPSARHADDFDDELDLGAYVDSLPPVDAPRRPIFADKELGAPFMSDEALTTVPAPPLVLTPPEPVDGIDPAAEPVLVLEAREPVPVFEALAPVNVVAELEPLADPDNDLEAPLDVAEFDLPPIAEEAGAALDGTSIDTLIRRLEAGLARRAGPPPPNPSAPAAAPLTALRDWATVARDAATDDEIGSGRALDTLQRLAARRMAG